MSTAYRLIRRLRGRKAIQNAELEAAFCRVDLQAFVAPGYEFLAYEDIPLPYLEEAGRVEVLPSPRLTAAVLQLLDIIEGGDLLVYGSNLAYLAALAYEISGGPVHVVEGETRLAAVARRALSAAGYGSSITVSDTLPRGEWSRALMLSPRRGGPPALKSRVRDLGVLLYPRLGAQGHEFVKLLRNGDEFVEIVVRGSRGSGSELGPLADLSFLLELEELVGNVWRGVATAPNDIHFRELTDSTFRGGPWDRGLLSDEDIERFSMAKRVFHLAYIHQMLGDLENAESLYKKSLQAYPTAEAHTFLGWTYSFANRLEDAIEECKKAIEVDPSLGNPYNDIGAYLIQLERFEEAVPWLQKAIKAERYCCYFYAHCNLGRVYMMMGDYRAAVKEFQRALDMNPEYELAKHLLEEAERLQRSHESL